MLLEKIDPALKQLTQKDEFSGILLIKRGDEELFSRAYGYASRAWRILNDVDMAFQVASITKMFTAVAVLQLIDRGVLSFESKVRNILKTDTISIPPEVKVHHLLTHTSGIPDYFEESEEDTDDYEDLWKHRPNYSVKDLSDFLPLFPNRYPLFEAGEKFSYCNAGYILLGLIIEKIADESYFDYVRKNVFAPADMRNSDFPSLDQIAENVAEGHIPVKDEEGRIINWKRNIYAVPPHGTSDGGALATAADLVNFLKALREGRLLSTTMTEKILTPHGPLNKEQGYTWCYGYGLAFVLDLDRIVRYGHAGDDPGVSVKAFYYPDQNLDLIILGNQSHCADTPAALIHDLILGR